MADDSACAEPDEDEAPAVVTELTNTVVAEEMSTFLAKLKRCGEWVGLSAFVIFSLAFRIQVRVWFDTQLHNVLHIKHTYWSTDLTDYYLPSHAYYNAIGCRINGKDGKREIGPLDNTSKH